MTGRAATVSALRLADQIVAQAVHGVRLGEHEAGFLVRMTRSGEVRVRPQRALAISI
jgi:hypothetical protein